MAASVVKLSGSSAARVSLDARPAEHPLDPTFRLAWVFVGAPTGFRSDVRNARHALFVVELGYVALHQTLLGFPPFCRSGSCRALVRRPYRTGALFSARATGGISLRKYLTGAHRPDYTT